MIFTYISRYLLFLLQTALESMYVMEIFTAALDIFEILFDEVWEFYKVQLEFSTQSSRSSEPAEWN